jgi:hypothetical protein
VRFLSIRAVVLSLTLATAALSLSACGHSPLTRALTGGAIGAGAGAAVGAATGGNAGTGPNSGPPPPADKADPGFSGLPCGLGCARQGR